MSQDDSNAVQQEATSRITVAALEAMLGVEQRVLDHGFVRVVDYMGGDDAIVQAARVSYGRGTRQTSEDRGLIRYLMRQWHSTPFEMCEIKLHVKLPIFVARQWIRHRTANVNEYSARYSILDREFYVPQPDQMAAQSAVNRQGRAAAMDSDAAESMRKVIADDADRSFAAYNWLLNEDGQGNHAEPDRPGLSRELARIGLGLNTYTQWYWKTDLHNLLHFLRLRADPHAQYEIRVYAEAILAIVERWVPITYQAFLDYRLGALSLSAAATALVQRMLAGEMPTFETSGLSKREWEELDEKLGFSQALTSRNRPAA